MKALKVTLLVLAGLVVFLLVAIVVLFLPSVQRVIVTRAVSDDETTLELDYFHAGLNQVTIRGADYQTPGTAVLAEEVTAGLSLLSLLVRQELRLGEVEATGLFVDLSRKEAEDDEPFAGILEQLNLPMPVSLERLQAEGRVLLPPIAGEEPVQAEFAAVGAMAPGSEGDFEVSGELASGLGGRWGPLGVDARLTVSQGVHGEIERGRLRAVVSAPWLAEGSDERLEADVVLVATETGETYQARLAPLLVSQESGTAAPNREVPPLLSLDAAYDRNAGQVEGSWRLEVDHDQLRAYLGGEALPVFAASGDGSFTYGTDGSIAAAGTVNLALSDLGDFSADLAEIDSLSLASRFDVFISEQVVRVDELAAELRTANGDVLLDARNFEPLQYDREAGRVVGAEDRIELAEVTLRSFPVAWANAVLPAGTEVGGGAVTGRARISSEAGTVHFVLEDPIRAESVDLVFNGDPAARDLALEASGSGSFGEGRLQAAVDQMQVSSEGQALITLTGEIDTAGSTSVQLDGDLAALTRQPFFAETGRLQAGAVELRATVDESSGQQPRAVKLTAAARGLAGEDGQALPDVQIEEATMREAAPNVWRVDLPMQVKGSSLSDVRLAGEVRVAAEPTEFELLLSGNKVVVDDLVALANALSEDTDEERAEPAAPVEAPESAGERDAVPVWSGLKGTFRVDIARVVLSEDQAIDTLQGIVAADTATFEGALEGQFSGEPVRVDADVRFQSDQDAPYILEGNVDAQSLPVGEIFKRLQPNRPPVLEGLFAASMRISGTGRNIPDLIDGVRGQVEVRSGGGIIRLLYSENPVAEMGALASRALSQMRGEIGTIASVASQVSHMPYREMYLSAVRSEDLDVVLRDITVVAPELHLRGSGLVRHQEGVSVLEQPMEIRINLGAQGALLETLRSLNAMGDQTDELGYVLLRNEFVVTGTPANPDSNAFYRLLLEAALPYVIPGFDRETEERPTIPRIPDILDIFGRGRSGSK